MEPAEAKQPGSTPSERLLAELCERSFLSLWSYPNVYRDQGKVGKGDGKEVCDVLAVFRDDVVIFSAKDCAFPSGPTEVAWRRWYKRAVHEAAIQLYGAERWLRTYPERLFLDRACTVRLPIDLPPPERMRVHRVVVALGASDACRQHFGGGSGSLILAPETPSPLEPSESDADEPAHVFTVGRMAGPFIHVMDDTTMPLVLGELDTVSDLLAYLSKKETFITAGHLAAAMGEESLLAYYVMTTMNSPRESMPVPLDGHKLMLGEELWPEFSSEALYSKVKEQLRVSFAWDAMIQNLSEDILASRMTAGNEHGSAGHERRVRALASAPRWVRDVLVRHLLSLVNDASSPTHFRAVTHPMQPDTAYLFLVMSREGLAEDKYRRTRSAVLAAYCASFAMRNAEVRHIVGVSTGFAAHGEDRSHEVVYLDRATWGPEDEAYAEEGERRFGLYKDMKYLRLD